MSGPDIEQILRDQPEEWDNLHVTPLDDLLEHSEDEDCMCDPRVEVIGGKLLVVHNAYDGRE